jgi:phosphoserine phosphatase
VTEPLAIPAGLSASLVLVRHGESVWVAEGRFQGRLDPPLSDLGRRQAERVAHHLAAPGAPDWTALPPGPPLAVWHSPLSRAAQTADIIAAHQPGLSTQASEQLIEIAQGEWEGLTHIEVARRWPTELAAWRRAPLANHAPGGEALLDAVPRIRAAAGALIETLDAARHEAHEPWIAIVAHDGIFRLLVMTLVGLPYERFWSLPFNLCAISVITLRDQLAVLRAHNLADHLAPLADEERAAAEARGDRRGAL